ncbi:MAG: hypothetical protein V3S01_06805 [Dehalococcoidia bacterium]
MSKYKRAPGYDPLITNAQVNRESARKLYVAGYTVREIADHFPRVFKCSLEDGQDRLGQRYSLELDDGRLETYIVASWAEVVRLIAAKEGVDAAGTR